MHCFSLTQNLLFHTLLHAFNRHTETEMATPDRDITLKLLVDKTSRKVVFAEAGKDFVDFLFGLLKIPLGSIGGLLWENGLAGPGSFGSVYESIKNLDPNYLQPNLDKDSLLRPKTFSSSNPEMPPLLQNFERKEIKGVTGLLDLPEPEVEYFDPSSQNAQGSPHEFCGGSFSFSPSKNVIDSETATSSKQVGSVKAAQIYMVMDNLMVEPMSIISSIAIRNSLSIKDVGSLEEKTVLIDSEKGLELVKAMFESETALTKVFLKE